MISFDIGDIEFHPEAAAEVEAAVDAYLGYSADSAARFRAALQKQLTGILEWPGAGQAWVGWDREPVVYSYGLRRYPYRIVYFVRDGAPVVIACAHAKRLPGYWTHRVEN